MSRWSSLGNVRVCKSACCLVYVDSGGDALDAVSCMYLLPRNPAAICRFGHFLSFCYYDRRVFFFLGIYKVGRFTGFSRVDRFRRSKETVGTTQASAMCRHGPRPRPPTAWGRGLRPPCTFCAPFDDSWSCRTDMWGPSESSFPHSVHLDSRFPVFDFLFFLPPTRRPRRATFGVARQDRQAVSRTNRRVPVVGRRRGP